MKKEFIESTDIENIIEEKFSNIEIEEKLIAYIVRKNYKISNNVNSDYFINNSYSFFLELIKKYNSCFIRKMFFEIVKKESNKREKEKNLLYAKKIYKVKIKEIKKENIESLISEIKKKYQVRKTLGAIKDVIDIIDDFDENKVKKILSPIFNLDREQKENRKEILEDYEDVLKEVKKREKDNGILIKTGIKKIDRIIGGVQKGEFALIAAETGLGKSIFLSNIAINAWNNGKNVVFFSLEMSSLQVRFRMYSCIANILYSKFRMLGLNEKDYINWKNCIEINRKNKKNFLYIIAKPRGISCLDIENELYDIQEEKEKKIDLVISDYLNIMSSNDKIKGKAGKDNVIQEAISWNLKQLAGGFNSGEGVALWSACQILDSAYGKIIRLGDIKYSRGISENAPLIFGLAETEDDEFTGTLTMSAVKTRDGKKIKPFQLISNFDFMRFDNVEERKREWIDFKTGEIS